MKYLPVSIIAAILGFCASASFSQSIAVKGSCTVAVSGGHNLTIHGTTQADNKDMKSQLSNILWIRDYYAELSRKSPQGATMYERMLVAAENSGGFNLLCRGKEGYLTISSLGFEMDNDAFAGKAGTYPLVGSKTGSDLPPGFMAAFIATVNGAMLALSPTTEAGELTITKFTHDEIAGNYSFADKGNNVNGDFKFTRVVDDG